MPCRDDRDYQVTQGDVDAAARAVRAELEPLLCEAMAALENKGLLPGQLSPQLLKWYETHSKREQHRVALEAAQKLTVKERKALGIDMDILRRRAKSLV
jgi:hypothetical protein